MWNCKLNSILVPQSQKLMPVLLYSMFDFKYYLSRKIRIRLYNTLDLSFLQKNGFIILTLRRQKNVSFGQIRSNQVSQVRFFYFDGELSHDEKSHGKNPRADLVRYSRRGETFSLGENLRCPKSHLTLGLERACLYITI